METSGTRCLLLTMEPVDERGHMCASSFSRGLRKRGGSSWTLVAVLGLLLPACDSLLEVSLPGATEADALKGPESASLLVLSAQGDFECAYSNYVYGTGHLSGELVGGSLALQTPYTTRDLRPIHQGFAELGCNDTNPVGIYTPLQVARFMADDAFKRLSDFSDAEVPNRIRLLGHSALWAGFAYTMFAESFCSCTFDLGPELEPQQVFQTAKERFTTAIEFATQAGDTETLNTAYVGRARVRLHLGETAEAAADARKVPAGFRKNVTRSISHARRRNAIYSLNYLSSTLAIDPTYWNVTWQGVADPRVRLIDTGRLHGRTPLMRQTKYTSESAPIRLASYVEARLIIAEVEGGQTAVAIINELHQAAGIPAFASDDPAEIRRQIIEERRREFFLEGRRMGDLRRFGGFAQAARANQVDPYSGTLFGGTECFPLPDVERRNNPNL
jgi:starch-binding outer membrane protein, SusD/RagB family